MTNGAEREGRHSIPLIPVEALPAWLELVSALEVHGPAPCEESSSPDDWHADKKASQRLSAALDDCARCGASPECLAYALAADERFGIWGGRTEQERNAASRRFAA